MGMEDPRLAGEAILRRPDSFDPVTLHPVLETGCAINILERLIAGRVGWLLDEQPSEHRILPRIFPRRAGRCPMATATRSRSKTRNNQVRKQVSSSPIRRESDFSHAAPSPTQVARESEPLEGALRRKEAPETRQSRHSEAPDAGCGVHALSDDPFTHGRSRS